MQASTDTKSVFLDPFQSTDTKLTFLEGGLVELPENNPNQRNNDGYEQGSPSFCQSLVLVHTHRDSSFLPPNTSKLFGLNPQRKVCPVTAI
jgi:hypothetical protein